MKMLLGLASSQYDQMGLICPILIFLKIHLRDLFGPEADLDWDEQIPPDKTERWIGIVSMLLRMGEIVLTRAVCPPGVLDPPELIGYADGSLMAYACAIYIRWKKAKTHLAEPDRHYVCLVCAKARVTPLKQTTVPRSKLSGCLIFLFQFLPRSGL